MSEWYVIIDDNEMGPYNQSVLKQLAQEGELTGNHMVWSSGMPSWERASSVPFLQQYVGRSNPLNIQKKSNRPNMQMQAPQQFTTNPNHAYGNAYAPPSNSSGNYNEESKAVGVADWILTFILFAIPVVNIILLIVWAADGSTNESKRNWAKAWLILSAVGIGFWLLIFLIFLLAES